jgi:hypothetical protein
MGRVAVRILFVFDPERRAVLLVADDKTGQWLAWYRPAIPLAEVAAVDKMDRRGRAADMARSTGWAAGFLSRTLWIGRWL